jgi:hypothetical protein
MVVDEFISFILLMSSTKSLSLIYLLFESRPFLVVFPLCVNVIDIFLHNCTTEEDIRKLWLSDVVVFYYP